MDTPFTSVPASVASVVKNSLMQYSVQARIYHRGLRGSRRGTQRRIESKKLETKKGNHSDCLLCGTGESYKRFSST